MSQVHVYSFIKEEKTVKSKIQNKTYQAVFNTESIYYEIYIMLSKPFVSRWWYCPAKDYLS